MAESSIWTLDQLLRQRAVDEDQTPLLAFPKTRYGITNYDPISGATLDRFVDGAANCLIGKGFPYVNDEVVVGICAPTDLDYIVTIFALIRLGYTVFQLSPRLPPSAVGELLSSVHSKKDHRQALLYSPDFASFKPEALGEYSLDLHSIVSRDEYDTNDKYDADATRLRFERERGDCGGEKQHQRRCLILHSSGSTGLPKPIDYAHRKLLAAGLYAQDATAFITMPFSHALGMMSYMQSLARRRTMYAVSGYVPQTHDTVTAAIRAAQPDIVWTVPYVLKLLAERPDGIEAIRGCRYVSSGGSKLSDELGDKLTEAGVHVGMQFGSTETGLLMSSAYRPREDKAWNYLRPPPHAAPYVTFQKVDDGNAYECVVLDGHRGKTASNSDDPPGSWHTSDLFVPHPTIPNAWKFIARMDDRITLSNGEKVLPLTMEGHIRQHPLVREAVMFGIGREFPGLLVFRATGPTEQQSDSEQFIEEIWPQIEHASSHAESFSQITREMVVVLGSDVECPLTDKNSVKRGALYREFAPIIDAVYAAYESSHKAQALQLTVPELEGWILDALRAQGREIDSPAADLFSAGVDSLQAIRLRSSIVRNLDLGGHEAEIPPMMVLDCGNAGKLARRLYAFRLGQSLVETGQYKGVEAMESLIEKYSDFSEYNREYPVVLKNGSQGDGHIVILTGGTGFLGAHILAALAELSSIRKVYAFVRRNEDDDQTPKSRLEASLRSKGFSISMTSIVPVYCDITKDKFGLDDVDMYDEMRSEVTHIIHCAWAVNFAIPLAAFEPQIKGLHRLLAFSMRTERSAKLLFCSSISVAQSTQSPAVVAAAPISLLSDCSPTGYAQSKLVGERIIESAAAAIAAPAYASMAVLRIGQVIPGRRRGTKLWNPNEAVPLMIQSAREDSAGALPLLDDVGRDACSWIEADVLADAIVQLARIENPTSVETGTEQQEDPVLSFYNLVNPSSFSWGDELLPSLRRAGLAFDVVSWKEWLKRLRASPDDANRNPSKKLLQFWSGQREGGGAVSFDTASTEAASTALGSAKRAVDGDFLSQLVNAWEEYRTVSKTP